MSPHLVSLLVVGLAIGWGSLLLGGVLGVIPFGEHVSLWLTQILLMAGIALYAANGSWGWLAFYATCAAAFFRDSLKHAHLNGELKAMERRNAEDIAELVADLLGPR